jgi:hypothetical protein
VSQSLTIRELVTRWAFKGDTVAIDRFNKKIERVGKVASRVRAGINRAGQAAMRGMVRAGKVVALSLAAASVAVIKTAADAEESESKFEAVFKDMAGSARVWSDELAKRIGRSGYQLREFASRLQDTFVPLGFARGKAADLSKQLTELAIDVSSFNNVAEDETISLFTSAIVGNHEAVRRFGIIITQARLKEKLSQLKREMSGFNQMSVEQQKVMARYQIILESTSDAHGDAEKTAGSFTNRMRALKARIHALSVTIGKEMLPYVAKWVQAASDWIDKNQEVIKQKLPEILKETAEALKIIAGAVAVIGKALRWIFNILVSIGEAIGTLFGMMYVQVENAIDAVTGFFGTIHDEISGMWERGLAGFNAISARLSELGGLIWGAVGQPFVDAVSSIWDAFKQFWAGLWAAISEFGTRITAPFKAAWGAASGLFGRVHSALSGMAKQIWSSVTEPINRAIVHAKEQIRYLVIWGLEQFQKLISWNPFGAQTSMGKALDLFKKAQVAQAAVDRRASIAPLTAAVAPGGIAATPAGPVTSESKTVSIQAPVTVNVPPGTPASEAERVGDAASVASARTYRRALGDIRR